MPDLLVDAFVDRILTDAGNLVLLIRNNGVVAQIRNGQV